MAIGWHVEIKQIMGDDTLEHKFFPSKEEAEVFMEEFNKTGWVPKYATWNEFFKEDSP